MSQEEHEAVARVERAFSAEGNRKRKEVPLFGMAPWLLLMADVGWRAKSVAVIIDGLVKNSERSVPITEVSKYVRRGDRTTKIESVRADCEELERAGFVTIERPGGKGAWRVTMAYAPQRAANGKLTTNEHSLPVITSLRDVATPPRRKRAYDPKREPRPYCAGETKDGEPCRRRARVQSRFCGTAHEDSLNPPTKKVVQTSGHPPTKKVGVTPTKKVVHSPTKKVVQDFQPPTETVGEVPPIYVGSIIDTIGGGPGGDLLRRGGAERSEAESGEREVGKKSGATEISYRRGETNPTDLVLCRLADCGSTVRGSGRDHWEAQCPAHDDRHPSLSVSIGDDERALVNCHAGCDTADVLGALGLAPADLFAAHPPCRTAETIYPYTDADGQILYEIVRSGGKKFAVRQPRSDGTYEWSKKGVTIVPYHLPALLTAVEAGESVYIVEGEKDCDALAARGIVATTNPFGAGKWPESWGSEYFAGAQVTVVPDNDDPGWKHASEVADSLSGHAETVEMVELPEVPEHGDVSDFLVAHSVEAFREIEGFAYVANGTN
jgi:hypothetical protein